jgi:hypothetical protein
MALTILPEPGTGDGLVGHWAFNEVAGSTAADASSNGHTGAITGASWTTGRIGGALNFDGNDYVDMGDVLDFPSPADFTIAAWINPTTIDTSDQRTIVSKWAGSGSNERTFRFEIEKDRTMVVLLAAKENVVKGNTVLQTGNWYHVALTVSQSDNTVRLYVNGIEEDANTNFTTSLGNSSQPLHIGNRSDNSQFYNGLIDDVRIYDSALSSGEVNALANYFFQ